MSGEYTSLDSSDWEPRPKKLNNRIVVTGFFTLAAGAAIGVESFTAGKLIAVVLR